jgi:hypothetical protein
VEESLVRDALGDQVEQSKQKADEVAETQSLTRRTTYCRISACCVSLKSLLSDNSAHMHEGAFRDSAEERKIYEIGVRVRARAISAHPSFCAIIPLLPVLSRRTTLASLRNEKGIRPKRRPLRQPVVKRGLGRLAFKQGRHVARKCWPN